MSEDAPAAAPVAPAEPSTPAAPAPEVAPAPAPEQTAPAPATAPTESATNNYFTNEQLAEMQTMFANNGGFDKAWAKMKDAISRPQNASEAAQVPQTPQVSSQQPQAPQSAPQPLMDGTYSMEELMVAAQFEKYAQEPKYASIKDDIMGQKVLQGLKDFNINIVENGRFNDGGIRKYLDLYAATKPAKPTSAEPTNDTAMANDISNIKEITTMDEANRIQLDDIRRRNAGQPGNPLAEKAKEFVRSYYKNQATGKRQAHLTDSPLSGLFLIGEISFRGKIKI